MQVGMVGLGKMGANMTLRLLRADHDVVVYDVRPDAAEQVVNEGAVAASSLEQLADKLRRPRAIWLMVPAGPITGNTIDALAEVLNDDDTIIDGGNSFYRDTLERAERLRSRGLHLVDAGTSGGIWGLGEGYCLMIGADRPVFERLEPLFATLATESGYAHVGRPGAGHYSKMVHNGIEYALMQSYGEGFELLKASDFDLNVAQVAELWRHGTVIRSWLLDLAAKALERDPELEDVQGYVEDSGEGRWTVEAAIDHAVPAPAITLALFERFASRRDNTFANKVIAALRREFGGHAVRKAVEEKRQGPG